MKLNNISLTYQGRGNQLLGICSGDTENLKLQVNSLFNRAAMNGEPQWFSPTMFEFWTSKARMLAYFKSRLHGPMLDKYGAEMRLRQRRAFATQRAKGLSRKNAHEIAKRVFDTQFNRKLNRVAARQMKWFLASPVIGQRTFRKKRINSIEPETFGMGVRSAERPDERESHEVEAYSEAARREDGAEKSLDV